MNKENSILIACSMLEPEINKSKQAQGLDLPVVWVDRALHEVPKQLQEHLQTEINKHQDKQYILLGFCLCGNSVLDLVSPQAILVIPKFDDCIRMYLTTKPGVSPQTRTDCMYYTSGWLDYGEAIQHKLKQYMEQYGEKKGQRLLQLMYGHYNEVKLIALPSYGVEEYLPIAEQIASTLGLKAGVCQGTMRSIDKLLTRAWDEEFCVFGPGERVTMKHFDGRAI